MNRRPSPDLTIKSLVDHPRTGRNPLRVCMVVGYDLSEPGGVKHHAQELAGALRAQGDRVTTIGPSAGPVDGEHVVRFKGVWRAVSNGSENAFGLLVSPWRVWRYFRRHKFDVIHVHEPLLPSLAYWALWATPNTPHVATFHAFGEHRPALLRAASRLGALGLYPLIQRAIAVSSAAARYATSTWSRPIAVIPNGVSTRLFSPKPISRSNTLRLLFVGRLSDERKGIKYLLDAYGSARNRGVDVTLDVVGENHGAPIPALDGVTFHGRLPLDQLVRRYRECDVFVAPSTGQESFGIVLLEAMSCGKALLCSDIDGYRSTAIKDGSMLVTPCNAHDLALAIEVLAADPARVTRMGEFNRERVCSYDWRHVADQVRGEYLLARVRSIAPFGPPLLDPVVSKEFPEPVRPAAMGP